MLRPTHTHTPAHIGKVDTQVSASSVMFGLCVNRENETSKLLHFWPNKQS